MTTKTKNQTQPKLADVPTPVPDRQGPQLEGAHLSHEQAAALVRRLQAEIYRNQRLCRAVIEYYGSDDEQRYEALRAKYVVEAEERAYHDAYSEPKKSSKARR